MKKSEKTELFSIYYKNSKLTTETIFESEDKKYTHLLYYGDIFSNQECSNLIGSIRGTIIINTTDNSGIATTTVFLNKNRIRKYKNGGGITVHFYIPSGKKQYFDRKGFSSKNKVLSASGGLAAHLSGGSYTFNLLHDGDTTKSTFLQAE